MLLLVLIAIFFAAKYEERITKLETIMQTKKQSVMLIFIGKKSIKYIFEGNGINENTF